ncbi:MAG: alanine-zipper protein [Caldimicrobium sp.]
MKGLAFKFGGLLIGSALLFACSCPAPQVAEEAKPVQAAAPAEPECCTKLQNELNALKMEVESLKSQLGNVKVQAEDANKAAQKAIEAANKAEEAAQRAETAATKAERIFEKGLKK